MKTLIIIPVLYLAILNGCTYSNTQTEKISKQLPKSAQADTSDFYIYDFIKTVIAEQHIDTSYGFYANPINERFYPGLPDSFFLKHYFLIDTSYKKSNKKKYVETINSTGIFKECLSSEDITYILDQKNKHQGFIWDWSRLNIKLPSQYGIHGNEYSFSVPLFSKNKNVVLIKFMSYSQGGRFLLFIKKKDKWQLEEIGFSIT